MDTDIQVLWDQISPKWEFLLYLSKEVNRAPTTLKSHWFTNDPIIKIPKNKKDLVKEKMEAWIKNNKSN